MMISMDGIDSLSNSLYFDTQILNVYNIRLYKNIKCNLNQFKYKTRPLLRYIL